MTLCNSCHSPNPEYICPDTRQYFCTHCVVAAEAKLGKRMVKRPLNAIETMLGQMANGDRRHPAANRMTLLEVEELRIRACIV